MGKYVEMKVNKKVKSDEIFGLMPTERVDDNNAKCEVKGQDGNRKDLSRYKNHISK